MRLGILMTLMNIVLNVVLIRGLGPIPAFGTRGAAMGTAIASGMTGLIFVWMLFSDRLVIRFSRSMSFRPDWQIIRSLFRFGLPAGFQGIAMNLGGVLLFRFIGSLRYSAEAQAAYSVGYTELFSLITWTSIGLMGATAAVAGQNLGAGRPERSAQSTQVASLMGLGVAAVIGLLFVLIPQRLLSLFGMTDGAVVDLGVELLWYLAFSGLFITVALAYTGGLQGTGDTKSPLYISIVSQVVVPLGLCAVFQATSGLEAHNIWLAVVMGHVTRCVLSVIRFRQGKWRDITVDLGPERA
jgi:Na+-driven multidrug efflux pump